ncbi:MAG TPA: altronate dehydratase family protein [Pirellulales bacterium]
MHSPQPIDVVLLNSADNVCVAARQLDGGSQIAAGGQRVALAEPVRIGHKIALRQIAEGEPVIKYGQTIGFATAAIAAGAWVHSHNLAAGQFTRDYAPSTAIPADPPALEGRTFLGYPRAGRRAGTRNYIAVISTVNCSASVSRYVARRFDRAALKRDFPNIDGVVAFTHGGGCGMPFKGLNHQVLNRVMAGVARHPNIGGYLLIGLGCETATIGSLLEEHNLVQISGVAGQRVPAGEAASRRPLVLSMQDQGGTQKTIDAAVGMIGEMLPRVNDVRREPVPVSQLVLGTNCGGSDGNSGVTCNPALGAASDLVVAAGGTVILGETTEIYGAEQLLTRRARTPKVAEKLIERIGWWEWYTGLFGATPDNNPSPGNKEGGLTTIYEKSLGAVAKGGSTALAEVYQYAEEVTTPGLVVMDTPGLDAPSVTGIIAGGAQVMVFTTGRGSCYGSKPTPTIKVASNTPMYQRMVDDMDINAGTILAGQPVAEVGREIFEKVLAVASGEPTKSESLNLGDEEFVPWNVGPTL